MCVKHRCTPTQKKHSKYRLTWEMADTTIYEFIQLSAETTLSAQAK